MAELAVFNIAKSLLEQLSSPAKDELLLWFNSKAELEKLERTVRTIRDVLHDAEQRQATDAAVQGWLSSLRDEMYKADDLFDCISTRALRRQAVSGNRMLKQTKLLFSKPKDAAFSISTVHKVKELRERLDGIAKDISQFGFVRRTVADERPVVRRRGQSHSYIREDEVIGREKERAELARLLLENENDDDVTKQRVSVIAVVGIGGQGKTSLAQLLYNAKEIKEFFGLRIWACVNDFSDLKEVLEEVMGVKALSLDVLQNMLRKKIQGNRFLLVLDDVWDDIRERWLGLKRLLDAGDSGSKILITTRSTTVAQNLATTTPYYTLRELSDEHAWLLFKQMAFDNSQEEENRAKEELGKRIVKKCANVPLAIRTIGSYLYKKDKKHWSELVDNHVMNAMRDHPENMIMEVLRFSYDDLPSSLKHCFVYCSLFSEDHKFDKTTLIHLWMAQGLLQTSDQNECPEDVGERYFQYLVQRCFFQDIRECDDGRIVCKMHDLFHSLAAQIAGTECVQMKKPEDLKGKSPRHLLVKDIEGLPLQGIGMRSLVSPVTGLVKGSLLEGIFLNFTSLRTLSLQHLDIDEIPSSIGKLVHLRYLDLMKSDKLKRLPDALCELQNLLILRLGGCSGLIKLPDDLHKLRRLRYMEIKGCYKLKDMPPGLKEMTSLVMLDLLLVNKDNNGLRCLKHLNNLTGALLIKLPISPWKDCVVDAEECMLDNKTKLSKLVISFGDSEEGEEMPEADVLLNRLQPPNNISYLAVESFPGVNFPNWLSSLTNLVELELNNCNFCVELTHLRQLYQLKKLQLWYMDLVEYVVNEPCDVNGPFFPSLETLHIYSMNSLKGWCRPTATGVEVCYADNLWFLQLSDLKVGLCLQLTSFPFCPALVDLELQNLNYVKVLTQVLGAPQKREVEANECLQNCSNLRSVCLDSIKGLAFLPDELKLVPSIRSLEITNCPDFKRHALFNSLQYLPCLESLNFQTFCWSLYDHVLNLSISNPCLESLNFQSLTRLKSLGFEFGKDQEGALLLNQLHHLTLLEELKVYGSVPDEIDTQWTAPPNLKSVYIWGMSNSVGGLNQLIQQLKRLSFISFVYCRMEQHEWDKLAEWEDLKALRRLIFISCNMKSLPEACGDLPALEDLYLLHCYHLICLPTWVTRLTSLTIEGFGPELNEKCKKPMGSYWPLIQNIPHLTINTQTY